MVSINVNEFKSKLRGGGAHPGLFRVRMPFPAFAGGKSDNEKLTFLCKAASLPASTVGVVEVPYMGRKIKVPGDRTFAEWTITIINDTDFALNNAFEKWLAGVNKHTENTGLNWNDLIVDAEIDQLGRQGQVLKTYKMVGAFPTEKSQIDVSWDTTDTIEEFTVSLQYQWWTSDTAA